MKIALSSYSIRDHINRDYPFDEFPRYAKETFGVDAVEICQFQIPRGDSAHLQRLKDGLQSAGVRLVSMPIDVGHISQADEIKREYDLRLIELWIDAAAFLVCPIARVNSGDGDLEAAIASYQRLTAYGARAGVQIVMENHGGLSADPTTRQAILDRVPKLGTAPDFGNFPDDTRYEALAGMAPRATVVHAKTLDFDASGAMPQFDFARCIQVMEDAGFDGYYSAEFGGHGDQVAATHQSLKLMRGLQTAGGS